MVRLMDRLCLQDRLIVVTIRCNIDNGPSFLMSGRTVESQYWSARKKQSEKGTSQVWGFSQAMPSTRYLYLKDCESSFSCLIPRILTMSSVTHRKEP